MWKIFSLIFWFKKDSVLKKVTPTLRTEPVKAYSARGGPSGKVGRRRTLQSLESKASHGRKTWLKDLSETSMKKNIMLFLLEKNKVVWNRSPLHPMLHMTGPTGMKVEELPINKARKINRTEGAKKEIHLQGYLPNSVANSCSVWFMRCLPAVRVEESKHPGPGGLNVLQLGQLLPQIAVNLNDVWNLKLILNDWLKGKQISIEIWLWNLQMQPIGSGSVWIPLTRCWLGRWYRYNYL